MFDVKNSQADRAAYEDERVRKFIEDNYSDVVVGGSISRVPEEYKDPFLAKGEEVRKYDGLSDTVKRRASRTLNKLATGTDAGSKQLPPENYTGYDIMEVMPPPINMEYLTKVYEISSAHRAAVDAKAINVAGIGYDLVETAITKSILDAKSTPEAVAVTQKKIAKAKLALKAVIEGFNSEEDILEIIVKVLTDKYITGNGYLEIGRTAAGKIGYVGHIPSTTIRVRRHHDGFIQLVGTKAQFFRNFADDTADPLGKDPQPNEIIHFKEYSPTNDYYGVPAIVSAAIAVAGNEFANRYNLDYFENKAVPRYVITMANANLNTSQQKKIVDFFEANKGQNHRTLLIPLPPMRNGEKVEFKMEPIEAGILDSSFDNYVKANTAEILMANKVPASKVTSTDSQLAAVRDQEKSFRDTVVNPEQRIVEKRINKILKEFGDTLEFKFTVLSLTDADTQSQIDERNVRNSIVVPNEIRQRDGLPAIEGGEKTVQLTAQQEADRKNVQQASDTRARDRSNTQPDSANSATGRATQGSGRQVS